MIANCLYSIENERGKFEAEKCSGEVKHLFVAYKLVLLVLERLSFSMWV